MEEGDGNIRRRLLPRKDLVTASRLTRAMLKVQILELQITIVHRGGEDE